MKKFFFKPDTKLIINRSVGGNRQAFTTTYADAVQDGDFSTCSGTVDVTVELHPDEYSNFAGCGTAIRYENKTPYLLEYDGGSEWYYNSKGQIVEEDFGRNVTVVFDPESGWRHD